MSQIPLLVYPYSSKSFRWIKSGKRNRKIDPLSTISMELVVAVLQPGTYDLGARLSISSRQVGEDEMIVPQMSRIESSIVITV